MPTKLKRPFDDKDKEPKPKVNPQLSGTGSPTTIGGAGGITSAGQPAAVSKSAEGAGSGRFTNLKKYIDANRSGAQRIAQKIGEDVGSEASQVREGIDQAQSRFGSQISGEQQRLGQAGQTISNIFGQLKAPTQPTQTVPDEQNMVSTLGTQVGQPMTLEQAQAASQGPAPTSTTPTQEQVNPSLLTPDQVEEFTRLRRGQGEFQNFRTPGDFYKNIQQAQQVRQLADLAGSESGRFQLLSKAFGEQSPNRYNRGQQRLDQLLLQGSGQAGELARNVQAQGQDISQAATGAQAQALGQLGALRSSAEQARTQAQEQLFGKADEEMGGAVGQFGSEILTQQELANRQRQSEFENLRDRIRQMRSGQAGGLSQDEQNQMFGDTHQSQRYLNLDAIDPEQFLNQGANLTTSQAANEEQLSRFRALQQLAGEQQTDQFANLLSEEQLGQRPDSYSFSPELQGRIQSEQRQYNDMINNKQKELQDNINDLNRISSGSGLKHTWSYRNRIAQLQSEIPRLLAEREKYNINNLAAGYQPEYDARSPEQKIQDLINSGWSPSGGAGKGGNTSGNTGGFLK